MTWREIAAAEMESGAGAAQEVGGQIRYYVSQNGTMVESCPVEMTAGRRQPCKLDAFGACEHERNHTEALLVLAGYGAPHPANQHAKDCTRSCRLVGQCVLDDLLVQGAKDRDEASAVGAALARQLTAACDELSAARAEIEELKEAAREAYLAVERGR